MSRTILLDTGPFVAMLFVRDQFHKWATSEAEKIAAPLLTCEAVFSETCFLLQKFHGSSEAAFEFVETGAVRIDFNLTAEFGPVKDLALRYKDVPMSVADACLVRMCEIHADSVVFTTDSDFQVYRRDRNKRIPLIIPKP